MTNPICYSNWYWKRQAEIITVESAAGFPLSKLLLLYERMVGHDELLLIDWIRHLQPISLIELAAYPIKPLPKVLKCCDLIRLAEILGVSKSQLWGLYQDTIKG